MFGRRRRAASNPAFNNGASVSAPAQTAAASAFLNSKASNVSLSAAAAAAALRSRPMTPTSVADVQTKRTMRRTTSSSSAGSSVTGPVRGPPGAQLERRGSSGSMTERTFRDPSPNRGSARQSLDSAPPVPAIPKNIAPPVSTVFHRRAASAETQAIRVASPPPNLVSGRGSSLGPLRGNQAYRRSAPRNSSLPGVQELTTLERPNSRGSVNFSYPTRPRDLLLDGQRRLTSPTPFSAKQGLLSGQKQNLVYDPNTRRLVPEAELLFIEQNVRNAAEQRITKKKKIAPQGATGTHLADGTVGGRIRGTAVDTIGSSNGSLQKPAPSQHPKLPSIDVPSSRRRKKKVTTGDSYNEEDAYMSPASDYESDTSEKPVKFNTRGGKMLAKKPSVVREDREREEAEDEKSKILERSTTLGKLESGQAAVHATSSPTVRQTSLETNQGRENSSTSTPSPAHQGTSSTAQQAPALTSLDTSSDARESSTIQLTTEGLENTRSNRVPSISPARNAHFLASPESLSIRHLPPTRSISPRKSALKHSPSSRGSSPTGETSGNIGVVHGQPPSEVSDTSTAMSDERNMTKKKSARVSFDESNVFLGQSNSPTTSDTMTYPNPQGRRGWFGSIGRGKKKDTPSINDDDDEVMKPRPALPSFGSVREKKNRDVEERPLVKPGEQSERIHPSFTSPATTAGESKTSPLGQSNDHMIGAVIAQDMTSKNVATSFLSREPLPPEVTSVEGSGYVSDSASSSNSAEIPSSKIESMVKSREPAQNGHAMSHSAEPLIAGKEFTPAVAKPSDNMAIPSVAITKASPTPEEMRNNGSWPNIPGDLPESRSSSADNAHIAVAEHRPTDQTPASLGFAEPEPVVHSSDTLAVGEIAAKNLHPRPSDIGEEIEDSDSSSIYSDAAEDLSDMQGDGFMSLDAIVESPIVPAFPSLAIVTPPESPTARNLPPTANLKSELREEPNQQGKTETWDTTQKYWSGLTVEKRNELERAARVESDEESAEEVDEPELKPTIKQTASRSTQAQSPVPAIKHNRTYQITPGAKAGPDGSVPIMRSSMRTNAPAADDSLHMRTSMRSNGSTKISQRVSQRGTSQAAALPPQTKASLQKKYRPMSLPQSEVKSNPMEVKKHLRQTSEGIGSASKPSPVLRRKGSAESDSSFKRVRPVTEGYTMKRSMRGSQQQQTFSRPQSPDLTNSTRPSRFSLRSLSPAGSSIHESQPRSFGQSMRTNRQSSNDSRVPTLRGPPPQTSPRKFPVFGRSKTPSKAKTTPTRASRFADSSDEEDAQPSFHSRFVESSDEEDDGPIAKPLTSSRPSALRVIPRQTTDNDGDSSDLPESDEEKPRSPEPAKSAQFLDPSSGAINTHGAGKALASGSLRRSGSGREFIGATTTTSITASGAARPEQKRRSSLMSILRRKKPDPSSKVRKAEIESAARRDTPLERSRADLKAVRQDSNFSSASGPVSPKLQKRNTPQRTGTNENWPLPTSPEINGVDVDEEKIPQTAGNSKLLEDNGRDPTMNGRSNVGTRKPMAAEFEDLDLSAGMPPKKKKKFALLRRALRLDD